MFQIAFEKPINSHRKCMQESFHLKINIQDVNIPINHTNKCFRKRRAFNFIVRWEMELWTLNCITYFKSLQWQILCKIVSQGNSIPKPITHSPKECREWEWEMEFSKFRNSIHNQRFEIDFFPPSFFCSAWQLQIWIEHFLVSLFLSLKLVSIRKLIFHYGKKMKLHFSFSSPSFIPQNVENNLRRWKYFHILLDEIQRILYQAHFLSLHLHLQLKSYKKNWNEFWNEEIIFASLHFSISLLSIFLPRILIKVMLKFHENSITHIFMNNKEIQDIFHLVCMISFFLLFLLSQFTQCWVKNREIPGIPIDFWNSPKKKFPFKFNFQCLKYKKRNLFDIQTQSIWKNTSFTRYTKSKHHRLLIKLPFEQMLRDASSSYNTVFCAMYFHLEKRVLQHSKKKKLTKFSPSHPSINTTKTVPIQFFRSVIKL